jgi:hypothetical protein
LGANEKSLLAIRGAGSPKACDNRRTKVRTEGCNWGKKQREEGDNKLAILERRFH